MYEEFFNFILFYNNYIKNKFYKIYNIYNIDF